jgi:endonuclease G
MTTTALRLSALVVVLLVATLPSPLHAAEQEPWAPHPTTIYPVKILIYEHFTVGYDEAAKNPAWVSYHLSGPIAYRGKENRPATFATEFRTAAHVANSDYTGSGYDRGHLCPAYAMFSRFGKEGLTETFTMSNVIPQTHTLNAGIWEDLESSVAGRSGKKGRDVGDGWAANFQGGVWIINGPAYDRRPASEKLRNGTWVPSECWSIVIKMGQSRTAEAYIMPNTDDVRGPYTRFKTSVEAVRLKSGVTVAIDD